MQEVNAIFFERVKENKFKFESLDTLKISYIVQVISEKEFDITYEEQPKAKKGKKEDSEKPKIKELVVKTKYYRSLIATTKKFKPPESSNSEASENEPEEEADKSLKASSTSQAAPKKITGVKTKATAGVKKEKAKDDDSGEEDIRVSTMSQKTAKGNKKKEIPQVYKKGKWNPNVEIIEKCEQLESESSKPNFSCSARNSNREVIRAAYTGNRKLLDKILESDYKISRLTEHWGVENRLTALKAYMDQGDIDSLIYLTEQMTSKVSKKTIKYASDNVVYIQSIDTGYNDKYAYGVATRKVALSRGGRQGNNAFVEETDHGRGYFDDEHVEYFVCNKKTTPEMVNKFLGYFPNMENQLVSKISEVIRKGNRDVANVLLQKALKSDGYGINEFYSPALMDKNIDKIRDIKKPSCAKKAFGINNLSPIHCACLNPNSDVLKHLLTINPEYQNLDTNMRKPVHYAACCESDAPLRYLVSLNIDTRDHDNMRKSPLMYACMEGKVETAKFLLEENRSLIHHKDRSGNNAIHYAAEAGSKEIIEMLLNQGIKIAMPGQNRMTALHIAAQLGNYDLVKFLLEKGAKVLCRDKFKRTPLLLACKNGNLKVASLLLQQGSPFDMGDSSENTPLHYACAYGYPEMIDLLVKAGAGVNAVNSWNLSPTAVALLKSYFSCLRKMLDYPDTNVNCIDDQGRTLVSNAIKSINSESFNHVSFLLKEKKADPNIPDSNGLTAFDYLCSHTIEGLVSNEIKPSMTLDDINNLKAEKKRLYKQYFDLFLSCNVDINHRDKSGLTPIFRAVSVGNIDGVNYLLDEHHIEVNLLSKNNSNIYHFLENLVGQDNFLTVAKKILAKCSEPELINKFNNNGRTAVHLLVERFVSVAPGIKGRILSQLEQELRLKKKALAEKDPNYNRKSGDEKRESKKSKTSQFSKEYSDDDEDEEDEDDDEEDRPMKSTSSRAYRGLKGGARMKYNHFAHKKRFMNQGQGFGEEVADSASINITPEERADLEREAERLSKEKVDEFLGFLQLFKSKGCDPTLLMKNPKKEKDNRIKSEEEEDAEKNDEDKEDDDDDYDEDDIFAYVGYYFKLIEDSIRNKIDIPIKRKPEKHVGYSLLHIACGGHHLDLIKFLIEKFKIRLDQKSVYGETELLRFISSNYPNDSTRVAFDYLTKSAHSDIELANQNGQTALLLSIVQTKYEFSKKLIELKAKIDVQDKDGNYPLLQAVKNRSLDMVEVLLKNRANPNLVDKLKRNSIHWAINNSNADADASNEIENTLLSSGADLNAVDLRGRTALHYAFVKIGDPLNSSMIDPIETVSNIISRPNVNINVKDRWGNTPLNYAAQRGSVVSAIFLIQNKAIIDNVNDEGNTPLCESLIQGHQNMCITLLQEKADVKRQVKLKTREQKEEEMKDNDQEEEAQNDDDGEGDVKERKTSSLSNTGFGVSMGSSAVGFPGSSQAARPIKKKRVRKQQAEEKEIIEYDSSESELEPSEKEEGEEDEDDDGQTSKTGGFKMNRFQAKQKFAEKRTFKTSAFGYNQFGNPFGSQAFGQSQAAPDNFNFGKKEKECSTFSIAIRRNWQGVAFMMITCGFDLSLAILDCFNFKKYNYVYTLLLKKSEAGVYQMTNAQNQNLTHLFSQNSSRIQNELYEKILGKLESNKLNFGSLDNYKRTSLHYACEAGCMKLIKTLLEKRIDPNHTDKYGLTPFGLILKNNFHLAFEFAQEAKKYDLDLNKRFTFDKCEHTALTYIILENKNFVTFSQLIGLGADINKGDCSDYTPLILLIRQNRDEEVKNLITTFRDVQTKCTDFEGKTIIHHVVKPRDFGSYENVKLLEYLASYADVNQPDKKGYPPLYYARQQESKRMEKALLKCKARETEMRGSEVARTASQALTNLEFTENPFDPEADFDKFVEQCKQDSNQNKARFEEKAKVDENAVGTGNYEVTYDGEDPYDTYMVKVDISYGYYSGNVFYKMQILRERVRDVYIVFTRWGRVGTSGQYQQTPFSKVEDARKEFCSIFRSKTGNNWEDRHSFVKVDKKYRLVPVTKRTKFESYLKAFNYKDPRMPDTHLTKPVFKLIRRICNYKIFNNALKFEYNLDESVLPLQSITKERLLDALSVLTAIEKAIDSYEVARQKKDVNEVTQCAEELTTLSSHFYELIPSTRYKTESIPPITNKYELSNLKKMMNDLVYFEIAIKLLSAATYNIKTINPIDYIFKCLELHVLPLARDSDEFKIIR